MKRQRIISAVVSAVLMILNLNSISLAHTENDESININSSVDEIMEDSILESRMKPIKKMDGNISIKTSSDDIPEAKTIELSTVDDINSLRENMLIDSNYSRNCTIELKNDIDLENSEWIPLGLNPNYKDNDEDTILREYGFKGVLNGNGYTIKNAKITDHSYESIGFFAASDGADINNINFENFNYAFSYALDDTSVTGNIPIYIGTVVGYGYDTDISKVNVSFDFDIQHNYTTVTSTGETEFENKCGGVAGCLYGNASDCTINGRFSFNNNNHTFAGGFVGYYECIEEDNSGKTLSNITMTLKADVSTVSYMSIGGIVGYANSNIYIDNCTLPDQSYIIANATPDESKYAVVCMGGICSIADMVVISNCKVYAEKLESYSDISAFCGGIIGYGPVEVRECMIDGSIIYMETMKYYVGGIMGRELSNKISDCKVLNTSIKINKENISYIYAGGVVGYAALSTEDIDLGMVCSISKITTDNVRIEVVSNSAENASFVGGIVGNSIRIDVSECKLINSNIDVNVDVELYCGGMFGYAVDSKISDCNVEDSFINLTNIINKYNYIGGIIGYSLRTDISNSDVIRTDADCSIIGYLGGIAGGSLKDSLIENCNLIDSDFNLTSVSSAFLGGISGYNFGTVRNCSVNSILKCASTYKAPSQTTIVCSVGGIVSLNYRLVENCISEPTIYCGDSFTEEPTGNYAENGIIVGGIVARNSAITSKTSPLVYGIEDIIIKNCSFNPNGTAQINILTDCFASFGGIAGVAFAGGIDSNGNSNSYIEDCYSVVSEKIKMNANHTNYIAGIVGMMQSMNVKRCRSVGSLNVDNPDVNTLYIGGIFGRSSILTCYQRNSVGTVALYNLGPTISDCTSDIDINCNSESIYAGGIGGYLNTDTIADNFQPTVEGCHSNGNIDFTTGSLSFGGGSVGYIVDSVVRDSYSEGIVSATATNSLAAIYLGGFSGRIKLASKVAQDITDPLTKVINCGSKCSVVINDENSVSKYGMFTSEINNNLAQEPLVIIDPKIENCVYYSNISDEDYEGVRNIELSNVMDKDMYSDWDFENRWYIAEDGVHLMYEKPTVYSGEYDLENGIKVKINSLTLSKPKEGSILYVAVYDKVDPSKYIKVYKFDVKESGDFTDIETNISLPAINEVNAFVWNNDMTPITELKSIK